jgi:hypothetical protein
MEREFKLLPQRLRVISEYFLDSGAATMYGEAKDYLCA